ncbi:MULTISPECIES: sugar phosphate isomerase/epimerase family protein [Actinoalloteichus]|uniref:Sugar phosphate isomerase/epimerase n=1 Tax=Actinoalloteichus fjordicus TaxID=1612552 RepID=A0AAC9L7E8_9PSEU|nr:MULTISPECIES: sugar phosphate isomerase/epimerase [Actinoalloteichus]APU12537.1 sugar phosphate isomerase/epimerase [Actinoalloteichus fjordicus]APU18491.1 sugar phosphate isomerase/epimerase [Actinoalloteichus sp. GBA129-24]
MNTAAGHSATGGPRRRRIPVGLSTASVWPQPVEAAFGIAADLGYDGVELMVWADQVSQDPAAVLRLARSHGVPVLAVHAPCLLITQRVWSADPEERLRRAVSAAGDLGASTVVVHPPFRWQRRYADGFADLVEELYQSSGIAVAVENMFPLRPPNPRRFGSRMQAARLRPMAAPAPLQVSAFRPSPDPTDEGHRHYTLDLSHTAAAHVDAMELAARMGSGLRHIHLADGSGLAKDQHLLPGRGEQPCGLLCEHLAQSDFDGTVVVEVNTRKARTPEDRAAELAEALAFARLHLFRDSLQS